MAELSEHDRRMRDIAAFAHSARVASEGAAAARSKAMEQRLANEHMVARIRDRSAEAERARQSSGAANAGGRAFAPPRASFVVLRVAT